MGTQNEWDMEGLTQSSGAQVYITSPPFFINLQRLLLPAKRSSLIPTSALLLIVTTEQITEPSLHCRVFLSPGPSTPPGTMEQVHGVDVSWMTQGSPKVDKFHRPPQSVKTPGPAQPRQIPGTSSSPQSPATPTADEVPNGQQNGHVEPGQAGANGAAKRPLSRSGSIEKHNGPNGTPPQRRGSWFSNISAKFSGSASSPPVQSPTQPQSQPPTPTQVATSPNDSSIHRHNPSRSAVLQHVQKPEGNGPYTPAPPKSGQAGFLGVLRRLSSSSSGMHGNGSKLGNGLVERKVLNVDQNRDRCPISELASSRLRRVAFCVDVEIAPMPKYTDGEADASGGSKAQKKKMTEKGEGEALKNPKAVEEQKETNGVVASTGETLPKEPNTEGTAVPNGLKQGVANSPEPPVAKEKEMTKKKEKKKKSEEERKARKEKKRKLAEANGSIPMEIRYDSSDSSSTDGPTTLTNAKTKSVPTTNPVRIYRRCCQLRESPILKKITEQLIDNTNTNSPGMVDKLDLTDYQLQYPDLVTLGDYLAVVPVKEMILENTGLTDEGLRVILAGLLAAKQPDSRRRKPKQESEEQGGVIERLVLKNNKLGPDGWKHLSLFLYMCKSLKQLDVSSVPFPRQPPAHQNGVLSNGKPIPRGISEVLGKALSHRLGGATLELLNIGETEPSMEQLGTIIDGLIECGVAKLGLAHNQLDGDGVGHVARYLAAGKCVGLDLGGNDLNDHMEAIAASLKDTHMLYALSLAGCNLTPSSLCKVLPTLTKLKDFRFIDLSHNRALFESDPSAVGLLRRYLPKMEHLKRIHLQDVNMTAEQAIAVVEVLPEVQTLAHINLLGNTELTELADARTEEAQEEACALFASLMAAARVSRSIICIDIEVPGEQAGEIVKAMAKQVVAYSLRNMEQIPMPDTVAGVPGLNSAEIQAHLQDGKAAQYPDVLVHLVGHDVLDNDDPVDDNESAPDEDYVIGGTGVVKALTCCLKNRGDESRRQSGEFIRDLETGAVSPRPQLATGGKAKDMSKHLLAGARKIRLRLQPALAKAKANPLDEHNLRKLTFLDNTLQGIIKRFEDEYPDTRQSVEVEVPLTQVRSRELQVPPTPGVEDTHTAISDGEDEREIRVPRPLSRTNSVLSRVIAEEEGRVHRVGHRFRSGFLTQQHLDLLTAAIDDIGSDVNHVRLLTDIAEDVGGEFLEKVQEKGAIRAFKEDRELYLTAYKEMDPEYWAQFVESQQKARANINLQTIEKNEETQEPRRTSADENAISD
ncbi:hypothetical protein HJFPF1_01868 [Paramyrothecium foliicola]|nr:hypothetical protein HJFPF1_01868 [Paramyrothecium foliicola]